MNTAGRLYALSSGSACGRAKNDLSTKNCYYLFNYCPKLEENSFASFII